MDIRDYLNSKGFHYKIENRLNTGPQAVMNCPFCGDDKKHFAISLADGAFKCLRKAECGRSGSWWDFQKMLNDIPKMLNSQYKIELEPKIYKKPIVHSDPATKELYDFHEKRKIKKETVKHFHIGIKGNNIMIPHYENGELIFVKYRPLDKKTFWNDKDNKPILFNMDECKDEPFLRITEGHWDTMAAHEYGIKTVSVPNGIGDNTWIETCWDYLDKFERIYLYFDDDKDKEINAGQTTAIDISKRLGEWRCYNVKLPHKDLNECLMKDVPPEIIFECEANAKGYSHKLIKSLHEMESRLIAYSKDDLRRYGYTISIKGLHDILRGWRVGEVTAICGYPGSGKSTYLDQELLYQAQHGFKSCLVSLEMDSEQFLLWMCTQWCKKETPGENDIHNFCINYGHDISFLDITGFIDKILIWDAFKFAARKYGIKFFAIDSLMRINFKGNSSEHIYNEQKNFLSDCKDFAMENGCHVFIIVHPKKKGSIKEELNGMDIFGSSATYNLIDNLVFIWKNSDTEKTEIYTEKNRVHGDNDRVYLDFNKQHRTFYEEV